MTTWTAREALWIRITDLSGGRYLIEVEKGYGGFVVTDMIV